MTVGLTLLRLFNVRFDLIFISAASCSNILIFRNSFSMAGTHQRVMTLVLRHGRHCNNSSAPMAAKGLPILAIAEVEEGVDLPVLL